MNRLQIRNLVIETTGRDDKTTLINSAINIALNKVSAEHLWSDLMTEATATMTAGTNTLALASDLRRLIEFRVMDGLQSYKLIILPKSRVLGWFSDPTAYSNTKPRYGWLEGTTLSVVAPPDAAYECDYTYCRLHPDLDADDESVLIPQVDEAVVAYTTYWTFKSIEKHEDAQQWLGDYAILIRDAKKVDSSPAVERPGVERGSGHPLTPDFHLNPFIRGTH